MNRSDLQDLALIRCRDAQVLLESGNYEGSYYLCGYVVECGLKARIAKQTRLHDFPDKKAVNASYSHNLKDLVKIASLGPDPDKELGSNPDFSDNWNAIIGMLSKTGPRRAGTRNIPIMKRKISILRSRMQNKEFYSG